MEVVGRHISKLLRWILIRAINQHLAAPGLIFQIHFPIPQFRKTFAMTASTVGF
jgi:hypothetical protein